MKLRLLFLGIVGFSLSACLKTESQSGYSLSPNDKYQVSRECIEMQKNGNIFALLEKIKISTNHILSLLEQKDVTQYEQEIFAHADIISKVSKNVQELSKSEWSVSKYNRQISWTIDQNDFKNFFKIDTGWFKFDNAKVIDVFLAGKNSPELKKNIFVINLGDKIQINYITKASALELCQIEKTLMIVLEVNHDNLLKTVTRYFNLIVRDGE